MILDKVFGLATKPKNYFDGALRELKLGCISLKHNINSIMLGAFDIIIGERGVRIDFV